MTREIIITPVLNGYLCRVGCQQVVFTSADVLASELVKYYKNPEQTEKSWISNRLNQTMDRTEVAAPDCNRPPPMMVSPCPPDRVPDAIRAQNENARSTYENR